MITNMDKQKETAEITQFFNEMSDGRNYKIQSNPIVNYEQSVRSKTVLKLLSAGEGERILDIGCGNARDIAMILESGARIVGIDISEGMVSEARLDLEELGFEDIDLQVGDATHLGFPNDEFDKVLCSEVIEHIPDAEKALSEIWRVLKPGGLVVLSTPNPKSWYGFDRYVIWEKILRKKWNHPFDEWRSMSELLSMLEGKGFMIKGKAGACYIPGFLVTYFILPGFLQRVLIKLVKLVEHALSGHIPQYGYMVCTVAVKK